MFVYVSGFSGFSHGGSGMLSGVVRECSFSKWFCSEVKMTRGFVMISFVTGSRIVFRLGWSLALGYRPAEVFLFWWYIFALSCIIRFPFVGEYPLVLCLP